MRVDDSAAATFLERLRWGDKPRCPRCGDADVYCMTGRTTERERHLRWRCRRCCRQFSVRTGTPMEGTGIGLGLWWRAILLFVAAGSAPSSKDIERRCGVTYRSARALGARMPALLPLLGFKALRVAGYHRPSRLCCVRCRLPLRNTKSILCPTCRWTQRANDNAVRYAVERVEWADPTKEETWWKVAKHRLRQVNRELMDRSQRDAAPSAQAKTSRA